MSLHLKTLGRHIQIEYYGCDKEVMKDNKLIEKLMNEVGIKVIKGNEVTKIISYNNKITGVQIDNNNIIDVDNVICNADPPAVYEKLLDGNSNNSFLFKWKKKRMEYSMGLFVYYFGTKKIYENVEHHTIKFGNKYKEHLDDIFNKKICVFRNTKWIKLL